MCMYNDASVDGASADVTPLSPLTFVCASGVTCCACARMSGLEKRRFLFLWGGVVGGRVLVACRVVCVFCWLFA